jgi:hypothetical protein
VCVRRLSNRIVIPAGRGRDIAQPLEDADPQSGLRVSNDRLKLREYWAGRDSRPCEESTTVGAEARD